MASHSTPDPSTPPDASRRTFLKLSLGAGAGLLIGAYLPRSPAAATADTPLSFSPFLRISPDDIVTVIDKHLDMGQGNATGLATLVAEELGASPEQVRTEFAPSDPEVYKNLAFGIQGTGGSTAIANSFEQYRRAGAAAREMLAMAAAREWGVPVAEIEVEQGRIRHRRGGLEAKLGDFAVAAARLEVPREPRLRDPAQWRYIGKSFPRVDVPVKSSGAVDLYGMDLHLEDMVVATLIKPPRWGARVRSVYSARALEVPGVIDVVTMPQGVAVIAESTWPAIQARRLLEIEWDERGAETRSSEQLLAEYRALAQTPGLPALSRGDPAAALDRAAHVVEADYEFPYLAHAPMEPIDVTVRFDGETAEFWTGSQLQTVDHQAAARVLGLSMERVRIHTLWAGGSFGRRAIGDAHYVVEAATLARAWGRPRPIKLIYTREDDIQGGYYRPLYLHRVRAGIAADGTLLAWHHRIVGQSIISGTPFEAHLVKDGIDATTVEGVVDMPYQAEHFRVEVHNTRVGVPVLWWRSVGHTHTAYVVETLLDELADRAGRDPVAYRLGMLGEDPRRARVLRLAAEKIGWDRPPAPGLSRGVAVHRSFGSYVAEIAEVRMREDGTVRVERVVCAVDCGIPVNPDNIRAQVEGALGFGLGAVLRNEITLTGGRVDQANFDRYPLLRIGDMPQVEVHIVPSTEPPTGIGEPGTPPIGPAVANAIARATGRRVRTLPMSRHGLA
ncbi:MAG: xanthine dehydrogenase family protein molybdopterin-binding subunit [Gammaproteobacteria bacterium]|nr:MAG: xanthine dehydrogenase family protein molybdopterin-binding subunit [Gammaproteobacteria bacterium]